MKKKGLILIIFSVLALYFYSCEEPEYKENNTGKELADIWIKIPGNANSITCSDTLPYGDTIHFNVPYNYPITNDSTTNLKKVILAANLPLGAIAEPSLGFIDLSKPYSFTITAGNGNKKKYIIVAKLVKSSEKSITKFTITSPIEIKCNINETKGKIFIAKGSWTLDSLKKLSATYSLSSRATITPDPATISDFSNPNGVDLTVTAQDGSTKIYNVCLKEPSYLEKGIGICTKEWQKNTTDIGLTANQGTSITVVGNYLAIATAASVGVKYYDKETGTFVGNVNMAGNNTGFVQVATDEGGCLVAASIVVGANATYSKLKVLRWKNGLTSNPDTIMFWTPNTEINASGKGAGRKISIRGNLAGDGEIYTNGAGIPRTLRWFVRGGKLLNKEPKVITYQGANQTWAVQMGVEAIDKNNIAITDWNKSLTIMDTNGVVNYTMSNTLFAKTNLNETKFFTFNNSKFIVTADLAVDINKTSNFKVFNIDDLTKFGTTSSDVNYANFNVLNGDPVSNIAANGNGTCGLATEFIQSSSQNKEMYIYFITSSGGIQKYKITNIDPN